MDPVRCVSSGTGENTALSGIMRLVADAQTSRSRTQVLADRAAFILTFVAIAAAAATAVGWALADAAPSFVIERVVTVLVIACPHALGLAVPPCWRFQRLSVLVMACWCATGMVSRKRATSRRGSSTRPEPSRAGEFRVVETTTVHPSLIWRALQRRVIIGIRVRRRRITRRKRRFDRLIEGSLSNFAFFFGRVLMFCVLGWH